MISTIEEVWVKNDTVREKPATTRGNGGIIEGQGAAAGGVAGGGNGAI